MNADNKSLPSKSPPHSAARKRHAAPFARRGPSNAYYLMYGVILLAGGFISTYMFATDQSADPAQLIKVVCSGVLALTGLASLAVPVVREWRSVVRRNRMHEGLCPKCGYNLRGNTSARCPECGSPAQPQNVDDEEFHA